jgi:hypothetical protein
MNIRAVQTGIINSKTKPGLRPYWIKYFYSTVQLVRNPDNFREVQEPFHKEKGLVAIDGEWLLYPHFFRSHYPNACLFSFLESRNGFVKVWLYNKNNSGFFKTAEDREFFKCWIDPGFLYEIPLV